MMFSAYYFRRKHRKAGNWLRLSFFITPYEAAQSKKYKRQVHNKTYKNRELQNRQQENITAIYTKKTKSVNKAQVIRL